MAATSGFTTSVQTNIYYKGSNLGTVDESAVLGLVDNANKVDHVREVADLSQSANNFEFSEFGKESQTKVAGPPSNDDFSFTIALDHSDSIHKSLWDAKIGSKADVVLHVKDDTGETAYYIKGTISSKSLLTPVGDVHQLTVGVAIEEAPKRFDKS